MKSESISEGGSRSIDYVSIEIKPEDSEKLTLFIKQQMENVSLSHCICRVPQNFSKDNEEFYFPQLVSIGPFHKITASEEQKWRYLNALLNRKPNVEARLNDCVKVLKGLEPNVRKFYDGDKEVIDIDSDELVKMMLLDGCFIIELLLKYSNEELRRRDDPFFNKRDTFFRLRCDILLLENQIPFFVLESLFNRVPIPNEVTNKTLIELILTYFRKIIPPGGRNFQIPQGKFSHLLDLIHNFYLPTHPEEELGGGQRHINPVSKILESGIQIKKVTTKSLLNIRFINGVLEIPPLKVHNYTKILFRNLVAFEQCYCNRPKYVTSYVFLMGKLVQSEKDLRVLRRTRIFANGFVEKKEVLDLFERILVNVETKDFYYRRICEEVNRYKRRDWGLWCRKMKGRYQRATPLEVAGLVIAILFIFFSFIGTLFSILSFSLHRF